MFRSRLTTHDVDTCRWMEQMIMIQQILNSLSIPPKFAAAWLIFLFGIVVEIRGSEASLSHRSTTALKSHAIFPQYNLSRRTTEREPPPSETFSRVLLYNFTHSQLNYNA